MSKKIGEGGFGCVFHPDVSCKGESGKDEKHVSKIQKKGNTSDNELKISERIRKIKGYDKFFAPIISSCDIGLSRINEGLISQCEAFESHHIGTDYNIMKMKFINMTSLSDIIRKGSKEHMFSSFFSSYRYLLTTLKLLQEQELVHFDLKGDNVIFDKDLGVPIVIDFGLSFHFPKKINKTAMEKLYSNVFYVYAPEYYVWPIEVHFVNYMIYTLETPTMESILMLCKDYVDNCSPFRIFSAQFKRRYAETAATFLKQFINKPREETMEKIINYSNTWDNYAISLMYLRLLQSMYPKGFTKNNLIIEFSQLLLMNCHPDATQRFTIQKTKSKFEKLFYNSKNASGLKSMLDTGGIFSDREEAALAFDEDTRTLNTINNSSKTAQNKKE